MYLRRKKRGVILILTLWIVTVLSLIAYSLAFEMRLEARLTKLKKDNLIAFQLAKAGMAKAVCDLKNDMVIDRAEKSQVLDAEGDIWKKAEDKFQVEMNNGTYSVHIIDEESLIHLNEAHPLLLPAMIEYFIGEDEEEEAGKIGMAIVDWRDSDDVPVNTNEGSSERILYKKYIAKDYYDIDLEYDSSEYDIQYRLKNDKFSSVEELLDVYGIAAELFYGFDPEERKQEIMMDQTDRESEYDQHIMRTPEEETHQWLNPEVYGLRDVLTLNSTGKVNINTAGVDVLAILLSAAKVNDPDPEVVAKAIVDYRRDGSESDLDNDKAFRNVNELAQVEGISGGQIAAIQRIQPLTTSSTNFRIISEGRYGRAHRTIEAVVRRTWETFNVDTTDDDFDPSVRRRIKREDEDRDDDMITVECPTVRIIQWRER